MYRTIGAHCMCPVLYSSRTNSVVVYLNYYNHMFVVIIYSESELSPMHSCIVNSTVASVTVLHTCIYKALVSGVFS